MAPYKGKVTGPVFGDSDRTIPVFGTELLSDRMTQPSDGKHESVDERLRSQVSEALAAAEQSDNYVLTSSDPDLRPDQRQRVFYNEQRARIGTRPPRYGW